MFLIGMNRVKKSSVDPEEPNVPVDPVPPVEPDVPVPPVNPEEPDEPIEPGEPIADYIVSNASNDLANGKYYLSGSWQDYPVYKNSNNFVIYLTPAWGWGIAMDTGITPIHGVQGNSDPTPPTIGWSGDVIVTRGDNS